MNSTEIVLLTIIVFLFITASFMFVFLRRSFEKKKLQEQKKFEYKDIVNITPEFKFEDPGSKNPDSPSIDEIAKPATYAATTKEVKETENKDPKSHDEQLKEIVITDPKIIESHADDNESLVEDYSCLKLEDTLIDIEDEKKERKKRRNVRKKKEAKEESIKIETEKES